MALAFESPLPQTIPKMEGGFQRPQSALARGVHITELSDGCTNPEPIVLQETDLLMEQHLSASKLQALTGTVDLETVTTLELKVDTTETSLNNFGSMLPNLTVLKLSGSVIPNIRDLGSSLRNLEVLWMSRCGLEELDGVSSMLKLRELYLAYNEISDISPLSMLEDLEILDLEGNNVDDIGQIQYLTLCTKLQHLTLDGNPICVTPTVDAEEVNYDYRQAIKKILVHLAILDDKSLSDRNTSAVQNVFDADWAYLEELQNDALVMESMNSEQEAVSSAGRPTTAALKPATAYRPGSALRPSSGYRPMSSHRRPASISGGRPSTAWTEGSKQRPASSDAAEGMESASDLTRGVVICGNPSKALRARRSSSNSQESVDQASQSVSTQPSPQTPTAAAPSSRPKPPTRITGREGRREKEEEEERKEEEAKDRSSEDQDLRLLMEELQSWKMEHEKRLEKIRESKAPQVFTIDHNSSIDHSDEGSDLSDTDDLDFRPDSAMDLYYHQQAERSQIHPRPAASNAAHVARNSFGDAGTNVEVSHEDRTSERELQKKPAPLGEQKLKDYEKSLDEDQHLLKEYQRLQALERQRAQGGDPGPTRELRELRVPSAGPARPHSPRRGVSPKPAPFPMAMASEGSLSPGRESPYRDQRPRKIRIGPTGLPGSSHGQQPQIRDVLTPAGKPGLGGLVPPSSLRPPSSSSLQHRIRRTLPEVPSLPSRPPPVTKS